MTIEEAKKRCTGKCKKIKPLSEFNRDKTTKDGHKYQCRKCANKSRPSRARVVKLVGVENIPVVPSRITVDCMKAWWV